MIIYENIWCLHLNNLYLTGNSFYGYSIMNKARHTDVKIVNSEASSDLINDPRFSTLDDTFFGSCKELAIGNEYFVRGYITKESSVM